MDNLARQHISAVFIIILLISSMSPLLQFTGVDIVGTVKSEMTLPEGSNENLGWELLDNHTVLHIWNRYNSYYFNTSSGIQLTNHYNEYWSHNVLMLGYYNNDEWNLIYRTDELSGFNKNITGETDDYINATLWKDLSYGSYDFRLAVRYHLGVNDSDLTVIPYIKNLGIAIPFDIGFGWEMKDINIANVTNDNYLQIYNNTNESYDRILLNQTLNESFTNLDLNTSINLICTNPPSPYLSRNLYLKWNRTLNYKVTVKSRINQYNAPTTLFIKVGTLVIGQEKFTEMHWLDADDWLGISSSQYYSHCGDDGDNTIERALDGIGHWNHAVEEVHWFILDLGQSYLVKEVRGRSFSLRDPIDVDIFVSNSVLDWGVAVATGISTWQDTTTWQVVDVDDKTGRYVKVVIEFTEDTREGIWFGASIGAFTIFDVYVTIPNISPVLSGEVPSNNSIDIGLTPELYVLCTDHEGDYMNATWWSNSSNSWVQFAYNNTFANKTKITQSFTNATAYSTTYYWSVNLSDDEDWCNETYHFTTEANILPTQSGEVPVNMSTDIGIVPWLHVICSDSNDGIMTVTWRSNWSGIWVDFASNSSVVSGTNISSINGYFRNYSTTYWWGVNVTDGIGWTNATYHFTTEAEDNPLNYGTIKVYGTEYTQGEPGTVYAQVSYANNTPANIANVYVTVWERTNKYIDNQQMTYIEESNGCYHYNFTTPSNINVFMMDVNSSNPTAYGSGEFHVSQWASDISDINDTVNYMNDTLNYLNGTYFPALEAKIDNIYTLLQNVDGNTTNLNILVSSLHSLLNDTYNISYYLNNTVWAGYVASQLYDISNMTYNITGYINTTVNSITTTVDTMLIVVNSMDANITLIDITVNAINDAVSYINLTTTYMNSSSMFAMNDTLASINDTVNLLSTEVGNINDTVGFINVTCWGNFTAYDLYNISNMTYWLVDAVENIVLHVNTTTVAIGSWDWFEVRLTEFGEITPGDDYLAQITVFDKNGQMANADLAPTISLYDSAGNLIVTGISMTWIAIGEYIYSYSTVAGQPSGQWTTITRTTVNGHVVKNIIYWELESNPPEVTLNVVDNVFPSISAEISITNEGTGSQEYIYYWWITPRADGDLVDADTVDSGSASKLVASLDTFTTVKILNVPTLGTYWYKVRVYWGTEWSAASAQFDAISAPGAGGIIPPIERFELTVICIGDRWERIPGVKVDIYEEDRFLGSELTNETGVAVFSIPKSMVLSITATKDGYETVVMPISVSRTMTEVIQMHKVAFAEIPWLLLVLIAIGGIILYCIYRKQTANVKKKRTRLG